eukprot:2165670-Rhodomonas_salina.1
MQAQEGVAVQSALCFALAHVVAVMLTVAVLGQCDFRPLLLCVSAVVVFALLALLLVSAVVVFALLAVLVVFV